MKTRILALVLLMIFVAGVTMAQGALPMDYESVVLKGEGKADVYISEFHRVGADGQVDPDPFVVPEAKRLMITEFDVWSVGKPDGRWITLRVDRQTMVQVPKEGQWLNYNMTTGFAVAPGGKLEAGRHNFYGGSWSIIIRGYLTPAAGSERP